MYTENKEVFSIAKKGQKYRKYSQEEREAFIKSLQEGLSETQLSRKHAMPLGTVQTWKHRYRHTGTLEPRKKGATTHSDQENYKLRYEILKKFMDYTKGGGKRN